MQQKCLNNEGRQKQKSKLSAQQLTVGVCAVSESLISDCDFLPRGFLPTRLIHLSVWIMAALVSLI